jgi:hypoxanthine phosphoribosyltransferase
MSEKLRCELVSGESVQGLAYGLADLVRDSGFIPDLVVAIARGGFSPARFLCDALGLHDLTSIRIVHYLGTAEQEAQARVAIPLCIPIDGLRVLVVDDVNDTGETLKLARSYLGGLNPAAIRTAVLHQKTRSPIRADYAAGTVDEWRWLIYPWAVYEDLGALVGRMDPPPPNREEAARRLGTDHGLAVPPALLARVLARLAPVPGG